MSVIVCFARDASLRADFLAGFTDRLDVLTRLLIEASSLAASVGHALRAA
jgi:hypothetical protein